MDKYLCPKCGYLLFKVKRDKNSSLALSQGQFDAVKAGDYVCENGCTGQRGISGKRYYWEKELID